MNLPQAMAQAERLRANGRLAEAEGICRKVLEASPKFHPAWHALGLIAYEVGKLPLAAELIAEAIRLDDSVALYHRNRGEMCRRIGQLDEAVKAGKRATKLAPDDLDAHYNLGLALTDQGKWGDAIRSYRRALKLNPQHGLSWNNLGAALEKQGDMAEAEAAYAKAVGIDPAHHEAQNNLGAIYSEQGRLEDATRCFEDSIKASPDFIEPHFNLSSLKTYREDDPHLLYLERNLDKAASMEVKGRIRYWFALGKAREDVGRHDEAFAAYAEGNRLQHEIMPYDEARADALLERVMTVFDRAFFDTHMPSPPAPLPRVGEGSKPEVRLHSSPVHGSMAEEEGESPLPPSVHGSMAEGEGEPPLPSPVHGSMAEGEGEPPLPSPVYGRGAGGEGEKAPIFIVGMPRSGTTLLEQILSSHPAVHGAGELMYLNEAIMGLAGDSGKPFPDFVPCLLAEDFARLGATYTERLWQLAPDALRITDKMPANFFYIGMIRLAMPNARIIHAMRDPMDSCFSNYARLFNDTMEFAYDLGTLGRYYVRYIKLMRHWHDVLPQGTILDLRYEDMVADTEGQARRILDYVGLPWDDECLAFHRNKRHVKTASVAQVRKPIYKTSVARWQRFEKHLAPLLEIVRDYRK
ncbi:MAG: sulfotransferase [Nitrosomonadales bacterium]|nr:sulfotransferase [Nitrosomonadales bacterium]